MNIDISDVDATLREAGRRVLRAHPQYERALLSLRDRYARAHVALRYARNRIRYDAPPRPYRLVEVDPDDIEYVAELPGPRYRHAGVVVGGDWDLTTDRFADMDVYRAYERHFVEGVPWEDTDFFDRVVSEIESGNAMWECETREEFEERCSRLDRLYESIRTGGYRSQAELRQAGVSDPIKRPDPIKTERLKNEMTVNVGRDGDIFFEDGRNRLSIVKLLDVDSIPVRVLWRHSDWQDYRDAYVRGESVPDHVARHPDVAALRRG